ncbi:MAG: HAD domain-containing protein [Lachnospiraceae bacterium]|nr:HAD domain-containing protein [Lachnospiraceae bacterium]
MKTKTYSGKSNTHHKKLWNNLFYSLKTKLTEYSQTNGEEKVIFLDVDGVLNYDCSTEDLDDFCLAELKKIVLETKAKLVLTSSWKFYFLRDDDNATKRYMTERLAEYNLALYDIAPDLGSGRRADEIKLWLKEHPSFGSYVILDDCFFPGFKEMKRHLCLTDWNRNGLTAEHSKKAIRILNGIYLSSRI